jgi:hypothetical protein
MGLVKRRWYKPEREPARFKHWKPVPGQKLTESDLSLYEAELGLAAVADEHKVRIGRILDYDALANVFTIVGNRIKSYNPNAKRGKRVVLDPKPVEMEIAGWRVSQAVVAARVMLGVTRLPRNMANGGAV